MQVSKIVEGVSSTSSVAVSALQIVFKMLALEVDDQVFPAACKMLFFKAPRIKDLLQVGVQVQWRVKFMFTRILIHLYCTNIWKQK